jgi:ATP-dependent RNA helicase RhlE
MPIWWIGWHRSLRSGAFMSSKEQGSIQMQFTDFKASAPLERALVDLEFEAPTTIQAEAIPPAMAGSDVLGTAQTGTGKTLAYLLPALDRLLRGKQIRDPRLVVLAPTRELAIQIAGDATRLASHTSLHTLAAYGGAPIARQIDALRKGVDVLIATPGRLLDLANRRAVRFTEVEILVLDEADRMLDMGFLPDIDDLIRRMPQERQTLLFSATMPPTIQGMGYRYMRNPVRIEVDVPLPPQAIDQRLYPVPLHLKTALLAALLQSEGVDSALVFTRTKQEADVVTRKLNEAGLAVAEMHGDFNQKERLRALEEFRAGKAHVLVATNIAARGLDIEGISHVVNYDVPEEADDYIHRVGRTARQDADGTAWTLVTPEDEPLVERIEYRLGRPVERAQLAGFNYDVPAPDWARPSARTFLKNASRGQSSIARWKALTR